MGNGVKRLRRTDLDGYKSYFTIHRTEIINKSSYQAPFPKGWTYLPDRRQQQTPKRRADQTVSRITVHLAELTQLYVNCQFIWRRLAFVIHDGKLELVVAEVDVSCGNRNGLVRVLQLQNVVTPAKKHKYLNKCSELNTIATLRMVKR